jgi:hypothetical protein
MGIVAYLARLVSHTDLQLFTYFGLFPRHLFCIYSKKRVPVFSYD